MKKPKEKALIMLLAGCLLLVACGQSAPPASAPGANTPSAPGGNAADTSTPAAVTTLTFPMPTDVLSLNLIFETGDEGFTMLKPVYDPMYVVAQGEVRYYLAESREVSADGLTYTVKLRQGITWHDGTPLTADDVLFTFEQRFIAENKMTSGTKVNGEAVSVEKVDGLTFKVTTPSVSAAYDATLGGVTLLPKHIYEGETNISESEKNLLGIGNGPYKVKEWNKGESLVLERYEGYYRGLPEIETLVFPIIPNESTQEIAFENGEVNLLRLTTQDKVDKYAKDERYAIYTLDEGRVNYMGFNPNSALMQDIRARQAIALALNVSEIVQGAYGSDSIAVPGQTVFTPQNFYYTDIGGYTQDLETAKQLVAQSGLEGKTLQLVFNSSRSNMENCALIIQQQLKAVGIDVAITGLETQGFFERFFYSDAGDWELGLNGYAANADNQSVEYMFSLEGFLSKNLVSTPEIAALWNAGDATVDPKERADIYAQIQRQILDVYTMVPLSMSKYILITDKSIGGLDAINMVPVFEDYLKITVG